MTGMIAIAVLGVHAVWCLLCKRVSDGILGKLLYGVLSLTVLAYLGNPSAEAATAAHCALAAIAVRHFWMKTFWPGIRDRLTHRSPAPVVSRRRR